MDIVLHDQARRVLETNKVKNNQAGAFEIDGEFIWFSCVNDEFDCGETSSFNKAFACMKNSIKQAQNTNRS